MILTSTIHNWAIESFSESHHVADLWTHNGSSHWRTRDRSPCRCSAARMQTRRPSCKHATARRATLHPPGQLASCHSLESANEWSCQSSVSSLQQLQGSARMWRRPFHRNFGRLALVTFRVVWIWAPNFSLQIKSLPQPTNTTPPPLFRSPHPSSSTSEIPFVTRHHLIT